jgi:hypothetical protein
MQEDFIMRILCFCLLLCSISVHAEPRLALLIGNGKGYLPHSESNVLGPLPEPERDVELMRGVLTANGFVIRPEFILLNASQMQIRTVVKNFALELGKPQNQGATAWFFYAGHGVQGEHPNLGTQNFLIPTGRGFATNDDVVDGGVSAQWVLGKLTNSGAKVSILVLDACRNKMPLKTAARGTAMNSGFINMTATGAIVGFATANLGKAYGEGRRGNGLYTKYLVNALQKYAHLPMSTVFETVAGLVSNAAKQRGYEQTPWYNSGLQVKDGQAFCLGGCGGGGGGDQLVIDANIKGATVYIDNTPYGTTPLTLRAQAGTYTVRLEMPGYVTVQDQIHHEGKAKDVRFHLVKSPIQTDTRTVTQTSTRISTDTVISTPSGKEITVSGRTYIAYDNGTALDKKTGLLWMRCLVGQTWSGSTCSGEGKEFNWEDAKKQSDRFAGYSDWRIPTIEELRTLVYCSSGKPEYFRTGADFPSCDGDYQRPTLVQSVFLNAPDSRVWSGSPHANLSSYAWGVLFYYGNDGSYNRYRSRHVRLVRGGQ